MKMKAPITRPLKCGQFELLFPYDEICFLGDRSWHVRIYPRFIFDGASIPWWGWSALRLTPMDAKLQAPALIHDWFFTSQVLERLTVDQIFYEDLKRQGIGWTRRNIMYRAVRTGGGRVWNRHTPESIAVGRSFGETKEV